MARWKRIVVGIDGSECSERALQWAYDEAQESGAELVAVTAWKNPPPQVAPPYGSIPWGVDTHAEENATNTLARTVNKVLGDDPEGKVSTQVLEGNTAQVLIKASQDADLLVVGTRGHGGFAGLLLGSVSQQAAAHAGCTVVIVR